MKNLILIFISFTLLNIASAQKVDSNIKNELIIGTETNLNNNYPIYPAFEYSYSQSIYLQSEVGDADVISKIWYNFGGSSLEKSNNWTIYMGHTSKNQFDSVSDWINVNELTLVYSGTFTPPSETGWIEFDIEDFNYNGIDNLVIAVDENSIDNDPFSDNNFYTTNVTNDRGIMDYSDSENIDPNSPPENAIVDAVIPNIKLFKGVYPETDASIKELISPLGYNWLWNAGVEDIKLKIENKGTANLTSATINWKVNDVQQTSYSWTGDLEQNASEIITIGNYNFSDKGTYTINFEIVADDDGNDANNTLYSKYETMQAFVTDLTDSFEDYSYPNTPDYWQVETNVVAWIVDDRIAKTGTNCLRTFYDADEPKNDWAFSPYIKLVGGSNYSIKFWVHALGWDDVGESLEFYAGTEQNSVNMTDMLWADDALITESDDDNWIEISTSYTPPSDGNYVFGWYANSVKDLDDIAIDDFSITGETASVQNSEKIDINVYPNPTNGLINIAIEEPVNLKIYNSQGKEIEQKYLLKNENVNLNNSGIYFLKFENSQGTFVKKIIVK